MAKDDIVNLNAALKFVEFILGVIDKDDGTKTVEQIRHEFRNNFKHDLQPMLNQNWGIIRLIPLMLMAQDQFLKDTEDGQKIRAIRNAFAHNDFSCDENGYTFDRNRPNGMTVKISYEDFVPFLWRIENEFYKSRDEDLRIDA